MKKKNVISRTFYLRFTGHDMFSIKDQVKQDTEQ